MTHMTKKQRLEKQDEMKAKGFKYVDTSNLRCTIFDKVSPEVKARIDAENSKDTHIDIDIGEVMNDDSLKGEILQLCNFNEYKNSKGDVLFYGKFKPNDNSENNTAGSFLYLLTKHPDAWDSKEFMLQQHMKSITTVRRNAMFIDRTKMFVFLDVRETMLKEVVKQMKNNFAAAQPGIHPEMQSLSPEKFA